MLQRGVTLEEVDIAMKTASVFEYRHDGITKVGYYAEERKLFVGTVDGLVTTVMTGIGPEYVEKERAGMRMTYDREVDAAYLYVQDPIAPGSAVTTHVCEVNTPGSIHLDLDRDGRLLGVEILDASRVLTESALRNAERLYAPAASRK
ncbi:MAG: DUF2283 domain-containing protein [Bryobacteraceae bacterium]